MSLSSSARAPPSPPDSLSSSPKSRTNNNQSSCISPRASLSRPSSSLSTSASLQSLHRASVPSSSLQHTTPATLSPGLDAAISTRLPSSPSSRSASSYHSPSVSPNPVAAFHRAVRPDQDVEDVYFELTSEISSGDVAEAQGLIRSLGFGSPIASPLGANVPRVDVSLEEGEIPEDISRQMTSSNPTVTVSSMPLTAASVLSPSPSISSSPRYYRERPQRAREDSQHGNAIPSSPEVVPSLPHAYSSRNANNMHGNRHGSETLNSLPGSNGTTPIGNTTPIPTSRISTSHLTGGSPNNTIPATVNLEPSSSANTGIASLPSTNTTLYSLSSSNSFYTASSSSSIPTSASTSSVPDISICGTMTQHAPSAQSIVVSDSGTIQLPPPADIPCTAVNGSTLNPNAAEHVPAFSPSLSDVASNPTESLHALDPHDDMNSQEKSANVYINGLPPHFPEDQLFELAAPFGEIRSVRSFTRHVGEKESGYGFVLFETVEAAEQCIQSLRRFRNLHPTFSKQVHKIPGIPYTGPSPQEQSDAQNIAVHGQHVEAATTGASIGVENITFKTKMERLADPTSTNLYIEGLPLSIDEPSLGALVSPHRIKSSRFFQTRLSNPPRIIAFVRLETRTGAEEVVERLHGRMVRGWNDPGSRISVRFADTSEQRELRRQERNVRGDETSSPARLTIAQAALLNLRGRDQFRAQSIPVIGNRGRGHAYGSTAPTANQAYNDFSSNAHDIAVASIGTYRSGNAPEYPFHSIPSSSSSRTLAQTAPYDQPISLPPPRSSHLQNSQNIDPAMAAILGSLRRTGVPFDTGNDHYLENDDALHLDDYHYRQQQLGGLRNGVLGDVDINLGYSNHYQRGGGVAQARSGYTPAEEFILQAHAASNTDRRAHPTRVQSQFSGDVAADLNVGVRGYRTQASTISLAQPQQQGSFSGHGNGGLAAVLEDESQSASAQQPPRTYTRSEILSIGNRMGIAGIDSTHGYHGDGDNSSSGHQLSSQQYRSNSTAHSQFSSNRNLNMNAGLNHSQQVHVRSTTLPTSTTSNPTNQRHSQHSSMSIPKSRNIITDIMRTTNNTTNASSKQRTNPTITTDNLKNTVANGVYSNANTNDTHTDGASTYTGEVSSNLSNGTIHYHHNYKQNFDSLYTQPHRHQARQMSQEFHQHQKSFRGATDAYDGSTESGSPPLVSPALTYSSRGSAGTLSPSTPFVGSFPQAAGNGHGFQGSGLEGEV